MWLQIGKQLNAWRARIDDMTRTKAAKIRVDIFRLWYSKSLSARSAWIRTKRWRWTFSITALVTVSIAAVVASSILQPPSTPEEVSLAQQLLISVGGALMGATAIAFSLMTFAMQVNLERLPHGLFHRLSTDRRLMTAFISTFTMACAVAASSLFVQALGTRTSIIVAASTTAMILLLILYTYQRAILLVSPYAQISFLTTSAKRNLSLWVSRLKRLRSMAPDGDEDIQLAALFQSYPHWTQETARSLNYAIAFSRHFSERGDHEVSSNALSAVITINAEYVRARGRTFIDTNPFFETKGSSDGLVTTTLEHLRLASQSALTRGDERHVGDCMRALSALVPIYLSMRYLTKSRNYHHANLSCRYLVGTVESSAKLATTDVLLDGLRNIGKVATAFIQAEVPESSIYPIEKLALFSAVGLRSEESRPALNIGVEQLARLNALLLIDKNPYESKHALEKVRDSVFLVAETTVRLLPDSPLSREHSFALGPYFSSLHGAILNQFLAELANQVAEADKDNASAKNAAIGLRNWADGLYRPFKELLLNSAKANSALTFDLLMWMAHVTEVLGVVAQSPAGAVARNDLEKSAVWLTATFSWLPDDKERCAFVENSRPNEILFEVAFKAHVRSSHEVAEMAVKNLVGWAFKSGKHQTGWGALDAALTAAGVLCAAGVISLAELLKLVNDQRNKTVIDEDDRRRAAKRIRETANTVPQGGFALSPVQQVIESLDFNVYRPILLDVANAIHP